MACDLRKIQPQVNFWAFGAGRLWINNHSVAENERLSGKGWNKTTAQGVRRCK
jgi:hypothetical protein